MGLGKTYLALTEFLDLVKSREATRLVVICPNSFKSGWRDEILKQDLPIDCWVFQSGEDNSRFLRGQYDRPPVLVINYEAIRRSHVQEYIIKFIGDRRSMLVIDESIQIKTHNSQQTKATILLAREFQYVRILSGKPITQGPHDLWGQMRAIGQLEGFNFYSFRNTFCKMGGYMNNKVTGAQNEEYLGKLIDPHVFRATKEQWTDLPPKVYTIREHEMTPEQARRYKTMEEEFIAWLEEDERVTVDAAITKYVKLAQIQFGFIIDEAGDIHELVDRTNNPRINEIIDILMNEIETKLVVVYHHRYAGAAIIESLAPFHPAYIMGNMSPADITRQRDCFNNNSACRVIVIQTTAGRYGHTLVGGNHPKDKCSTMVFAENTWSLDTRSQLEDRIHRIGQLGESCLYIDMVNSKLDRRIIAALQSKQSVFDAVFEFVGKSPVSVA